MQAQTVTVNYNMLLGVLKRFYQRGEIDIHQYSNSLRRSLKQTIDTHEVTAAIDNAKKTPEKESRPSGDFNSILNELEIDYVE